MNKIVQHPCQFTKRHLKPQLRELYNLTEKDEKEHGFYVYEDNGTIYRTQIQSGARNSINIRMKSVLGMGLLDSGIPIATVHSHPNKQFNFLFSGTDFKTMFHSGLEFAAVVFNDPTGPRCSVYSVSKYGTYANAKKETFKTRFPGQSSVTQIDFVEALNNELKLCEFEV